MTTREKLVELILSAHERISAVALEDDEKTYENAVEMEADHLIANGVTVQERNEGGCPYCDIAKANEDVVDTKFGVKEAETSKWTMMGKRLIFCPMCGRRLSKPPKGE